MAEIQKEPVLLQARKQGNSTIVLSLTNFIENRKFYFVQKQCDGSILIKEADIKEKRNDTINNLPRERERERERYQREVDKQIDKYD